MGIVCLTCDIHHNSLGTGNQRACDLTEIQVTREFVKLLEESQVPATFFVTGKAFVEEWEDLRPIAEHPLISVQGHGYNCFEPALFHRAWKKFTGNYNGPRSWEKRDIQRTIDVIGERTGKQITCWRNHMYMHGPNTDKLLYDAGIRLCSDGVKRSVQMPEKCVSGLWQFPINVIPDHEHIYHAERTPEWVAWWIDRYKWSDDFGSNSYYIEEWADIALECLESNAREGAISNIIIHPITMYLSDRFQQFKRILEYLSDQEAVTMDQIIPEESVS